MSPQAIVARSHENAAKLLTKAQQDMAELTTADAAQKGANISPALNDCIELLDQIADRLKTKIVEEPLE